MMHIVDRLRAGSRSEDVPSQAGAFSRAGVCRRRSLGLVPACCLLLGAWALPATATDEEPIEIPTVSIEPPEELFLDPEERLALGLDEVILNALRHNVALAVERYRRGGVLLGIEEAMGIYDLLLTADATVSSDVSPPTTRLEDAEVLVSDDETWRLGLEQSSPWGGGVNLNLNGRRLETSDLAIQPNPQYRMNLDLGLSQPLLRNFGRQVTERNILVARSNAAINREELRNEVERVVREVSDIYWDLVEAQALLTVSKESLALAEDLHRMNRIQVEVGTLAPLEMVQSEVGVATREEEIIRRRQAVGDAEDIIRRLMNLERGDLWDIPIEPITDPEIVYEPIDVEKAVGIAFLDRPEVQQQIVSNAIDRLDADVAQNQRLPLLDLRAQYRANAVAGQSDLADTAYEDALETIFDREFDGWSLSLNFSMPLQNRAARARATRAELLVEQGELELRDLKDRIMVEVRRAARAVDTAAKAIDSAKVSSKLAQKNLEAEQKRYENGLSTSFQVLEIQEDLSAARSREVIAVIGYRQALTAFYEATGQLLEENGIQLADED